MLSDRSATVRCCRHERRLGADQRASPAISIAGVGSPFGAVRGWLGCGGIRCLPRLTPPAVAQRDVAVHQRLIQGRAARASHNGVKNGPHRRGAAAPALRVTPRRLSARGRRDGRGHRLLPGQSGEREQGAPRNRPHHPHLRAHAPLSRRTACATSGTRSPLAHGPRRIGPPSYCCNRWLCRSPRRPSAFACVWSPRWPRSASTTGCPLTPSTLASSRSWAGKRGRGWPPFPARRQPSRALAHRRCQRPRRPHRMPAPSRGMGGGTRPRLRGATRPAPPPPCRPCPLSPRAGPEPRASVPATRLLQGPASAALRWGTVGAGRRLRWARLRWTPRFCGMILEPSCAASSAACRRTTRARRGSPH